MIHFGSPNKADEGVFVIEFDHRIPAGPSLVGPFSSRAAANRWHDVQRFEESVSSVRPVSPPATSGVA